MNPTCFDTGDGKPGSPRIPWRFTPILLMLYAGAVAALSWPWLATASTRVLRHWDPPFHAWKLMFAARTLLTGHILPPGGNTNLYYPNTGAFFYEALHWPQAVFAAPLIAAGVNPVLTYHVTMVFFWALSGVLFWAWLRVLGARRVGAVMGGFFFTVIPYRMSYLVEFNMQLAFGLSLLMFAITRFFQRPGFRYALLAAVAWWLQATSELYQAVFFLFVLPLLILPLFARDVALLRSGRRFWLPFAAAAALCAALSLPFLLPYARTLGDGTLSRSLFEMQQHTLEPLSYLLPWGRFRLVPKLRHVRFDEMSVYPTLALVLAALLAFFAHRRPATDAWRRAVTWLFGTACALFAVLAVISHGLPGVGNGLVAVLSWAAFFAVLLSIPVLLRRDRSVARAAAVGLGAAGLFGIVMGFGPEIVIESNHATASNVLFTALYSLVPGLAGFRVVSRFSVFAMMALCVAAAFGVDAAWRSLRNRSRALRLCVLVLFLAAFVVECVPKKSFLRTRRIRNTSHSAVLAALDAREEPFVLAVVPMGYRDLDSEHMLTVERHDRLGIWAWGGTYPRWTTRVKESLQPDSGIDPAIAASALRQPWPETLVLEDRRPFRNVPQEDYASWFGPLAETIAEDAQFRLMRILPDAEEKPEAVRLVRRDFALALPVARFTLSTRNPPARVRLYLNGFPLDAWEVCDSTQAEVAIPPEFLVDHRPERFDFIAEGKCPFLLTDFRLEASPTDGENNPLSVSHDLPWLSFFRELPDGAIPLDIRYPGGMCLCGAMLRQGRDVAGTGALPLRLFLRFPETMSTMPGIRLFPGFGLNGSVLFQHQISLRKVMPDSAAFGFARGRIIAGDLDLPLSSLLRPGETYDITLDVRDASGRNIIGRDADGRKVLHAPLGIRWHVAPRN